MSRKKSLYVIAVFALLMVGLLVAFEFSDSTTLLASVTFYDGEHQLTFSPYYDEIDNIYYLFLPSCTTLDSVALDIPLLTHVSFTSDDVSDSADMTLLPIGENITMTVSSWRRTESYVLQILQCENLTTVYIETQPGALDYVNEDKSNSADAFVLVLEADGSLAYSGTAAMSGRGNSTWNQDKKPYNLSFSTKISVGPFDSVDTLCMLAEYFDESKLRNAVAYYMGDKMEIPYSSPYMHADIYVNGEYLGLYGLATKDEYLNYIDTDNIQAVFEFTNSPSASDFSTLLGFGIQVLQGNQNSICAFLEEFETALQNQDWEFCRQHVDLESFSNKYVFEEFLSNYDQMWASQYFYLDGDNVLHCMLPWDYDLIFGFSTAVFDDCWVYRINAFNRISFYNEFWYSRLLNNKDFVEMVLDILNEKYTEWLFADVTVFMTEVAEDIAASYSCDRIRWSEHVSSTGWDNSSKIGSLHDFVEYFSCCFNARKNFLINYYSDMAKYCVVQFNAGSGNQFANICVPIGSVLSDYIENASFLHASKLTTTLVGWYTEDGRTPEEIGTVTEDIVFNAVFESTEVTATASATATKNTGNVLFHKSNLAVMGSFGLIFLLLAAWLLHDIRTRKKV